MNFMLLLDTNIFLEILLDQEKKLRCKDFIQKNSGEALYVSRFSIYSVGIMLHRKKLLDKFENFINSTIAEINSVSLDLDDLKDIEKTTKKLNLDFDDTYQYLIAKKYNLKIVSLDKDFDKTDLKRIEP